MGMILSRQGGGVGGRGIGETNTELMKRHWRAQIRATEQKLKKLSADRMQRLQRRKEQGLPTIAIVGYTNAGKSSLFNLLTGKHKLEKDALFATLDSSLGKLKIHHRFITSPRSEILVSDTIGFIADLPPQLIQAFRSTLLETIHADLILHVIDSSDPLILDKVKIVDETLRDLGAIAIRQIRALNKIDLPPRASVSTIQSIAAQPDTYLISTKDGGGVEDLTRVLVQILWST
jgi:GTP-binding protein HflX